MPRHLALCFCTVAGLVLLTGATVAPASARIRCQDGFQMTSQGPIATPYCADQQIAVVAQSRGWKITTAEIGDKPLTKVYICQVLGSDIRLKGACAGYGPDQYAPGR